MFKHLLRDPASVNAMKQTCTIIILASENFTKTLEYPISYTGFLYTKWCQFVNFEHPNVLQCRSHAQHFFKENHQRNDQSAILF